jgi:3-phytase
MPQLINILWGEARENTNFKYVKWDDIARRLGLTIDTTGWNPRR